MKNILIIIAAFFLLSGTVIYQAVRHDTTMTGEGITGAELKVDTTLISTKWYSRTINPIYDEYVAIVEQSGTSAPTATVLETLAAGTVTWGRTIAGVYTATLTNAFTTNKTFITATISSTGLDGKIHVDASWTSDDVIQIVTYAPNAADVGELGGMVENARLYISIRVYP